MSNPRVFFVGLVFISMTLVALEAMSVRAGRVSPFDQAVTAIFSPVERAFWSFGRWAGDLLSAEEIRRDNEALKMQVFQLEKQVSRDETSRIENDQWKALLRLPAPLSGETIPAEVIAREPDTWFASLMINRGRADGVAPNAGVLGVGGAVGKVAEVGERVSRVMLLTDPRLAVPVEILPGGSQGILYGFDAHECMVKYLPHGTSVNVGDQVVTSGLGRLFSRGIPVGSVSRILPDDKSLFKPVIVTPAASFDRLRALLVVVR